MVLFGVIGALGGLRGGFYTASRAVEGTVSPFGHGWDTVACVIPYEDYSCISWHVVHVCGKTKEKRRLFLWPFVCDSDTPYEYKHTVRLAFLVFITR